MREQTHSLIKTNNKPVDQEKFWERYTAGEEKCGGPEERIGGGGVRRGQGAAKNRNDFNGSMSKARGGVGGTLESGETAVLEKMRRGDINRNRKRKAMVNLQTSGKIQNRQ